MRLALLAATAFFTALSANAFAQEAECIAHFHARSGAGRMAFPGTLATSVNKPCIVPIALEGRGRMRGIGVIRQPQHGTITIANVAGFRFQPDPGFAGTDVAIVRFGPRHGKRAAVRFAIDVR